MPGITGDDLTSETPQARLGCELDARNISDGAWAVSQLGCLGWRDVAGDVPVAVSHDTWAVSDGAGGVADDLAFLVKFSTSQIMSDTSKGTDAAGYVSMMLGMSRQANAR